MTFRRVAVIMAMGAEAKPLLDAVGAEPADTPAWAAALPCQLYSSFEHGLELVVAVNGIDPFTAVDCIGTQAASLTTQVAISAHAPDLIVSAGTAGGYRRHGAEVGDVYLAWPVLVHHDRRIALEGFDAQGRGEHPVADLRPIAAELGIRSGIVSTGDSLDSSPTDSEWIAASGAQVKEMEAAAVAWVARLNEVPVTALKVITDLVDDPIDTPEQFIANLASAVLTLRDASVALLHKLGAAAAAG